MSSDAQKTANRLNARKSTGPRSAAGKARSAGNALRHGMLSKQIVLLDEDRDAYDALLKSLHEEWRPLSMTQRILVERIAAHQWKLLRVARAESGLFNHYGDYGFDQDQDGKAQTKVHRCRDRDGDAHQ